MLTSSEMTECIAFLVMTGQIPAPLPPRGADGRRPSPPGPGPRTLRGGHRVMAPSLAAFAALAAATPPRR